MFKFDFSIDDVDDELVQSFKDLTPKENQPKHSVEQQKFQEVSLDDLLDHLPPKISFSPIHVPPTSGSGQKLTLYRRDLFDARFQLIAESEEKEDGEPSLRLAGDADLSEKSALEFVEAPSDLVPGVYEGGLKTWECSIDLVGYLDNLNIPVEHWQGKRILEIGCGTAVPCLYLLQKLFSHTVSSSVETPETHINLQDYNVSVLQLVTVPNLVLSWYKSKAASSYRASESESTGSTTTSSSKATEDEPTPTEPEPELEITPELKAAFLASLKEHGIQLRFFSGSWETFDLVCAGGPYDTVLTSETVYRTDSLPSLVELLKSARPSTRGEQSVPACLVAAKIVYFGVGGGVSEFVGAVRKAGGKVESVWETHSGVSRSIMKVEWD